MSNNGHNIREIGEAARLWALRVSDPAFADWDMFTEWLDANPEHLEAYEQALDQEAWATDLFQATAPVVVAPPVCSASASVDAPVAPPLPIGWRGRMSRRRWITQGAIAASVAAIAVTGAWLNFAPKSELSYQTAFGEHRTIELPDGSKIIMNGETELRLAALDARHVTMVRGEALFDVVHNDHHPFIVDAGETKLVDLGTVFNVVHQDQKFDVAVSEGVVEYQTGREKIQLEAGDAVGRHGNNSIAKKRRISPEVVGTWRSGYLQYEGDFLRVVVEDLSRNLGEPVRVSSDLAVRRLSGTIRLDGTGEAVIERAASLVGARYVHDENGWLITSRDGEGR